MACSNYSKVDEYGFERPENFNMKMYDSFMSQYLITLTKRAQRWETVYEYNQYKKSYTLKRFVRKGIPISRRAVCWMAISGADTCMKNFPLPYERIKLLSCNSLILDIIRTDVPRTFPDNIYYLNDATLPNRLYQILTNFAGQNPDIGYCQGFNYIAGLILLATKDEETTFWLFKTLVEEILPKYYVKTMSGLITDLEVLNDLVKIYEPDVHRHIKYLGMSWAMGVTKWFICLYADVLPTETVLRIWDCLFYEGSKILFRVGLTLIKIHKPYIMKTDDLSELMVIFRNMHIHPRVLDCHGFMREMFAVTGNLTSRKIQKLRAKHKGRRFADEENQCS